WRDTARHPRRRDRARGCGRDRRAAHPPRYRASASREGLSLHLRVDVPAPRSPAAKLRSDACPGTAPPDGAEDLPSEEAAAGPRTHLRSLSGYSRSYLAHLRRVQRLGVHVFEGRNRLNSNLSYVSIEPAPNYSTTRKRSACSMVRLALCAVYVTPSHPFHSTKRKERPIL